MRFSRSPSKQRAGLPTHSLYSPSTQLLSAHALSRCHTWCVILCTTGTCVRVRVAAHVRIAVGARAGIAAITAAVIQAWLVRGSCLGQGVLLPTAISAGSIAARRVVKEELENSCSASHKVWSYEGACLCRQLRHQQGNRGRQTPKELRELHPVAGHSIEKDCHNRVVWQ